MSVLDEFKKTRLETQPRIEDSLSQWAMVFLVLGILVGLICIVASGIVTKKYSIDSWGERGVAWYLVIVGVAAILQGCLYESF
jgi:hypothetical protein